jgi:NAD(P)-dependent dehydrogenase (short-subunit alcohol dehydrogenase family)
MPKWSTKDVPDQHGRVAIITGANSGLGFENAVALARKGATVIMACRNLEKGQAALARLATAVPAADARLRRLDLGHLAQVHDFAAGIRADFDRLDILINNAGLMAIPRSETADGFEVQFGVNHLGHFALTGLLLPLLRETPDSRVVTVSSMLAWTGKINFDDLQSRESYTRYGAYGQSKLGNQLFAFELARRFKKTAGTSKSLAAHPGYSATNLQEASVHSSESLVEGVGYGFLNKVMAQSALMGSLPQLYAATSPSLATGQLIGPDKFIRGNPVVANPPKAARSAADAARLWELSESLSGVIYDWAGP